MIKMVLEYLAIACFVSLTIVEFRLQHYDFAGLNFALVLLYVFLYIQPFSKLIK